MINDYIIRWKIKDLEEETAHLKVAIFKEVVDSLAKTFEFKIDEYQDSESNVSIESFIGQTEIMFYPKDRTFNLFYTDDIKDYRFNTAVAKLREISLKNIDQQ